MSFKPRTIQGTRHQVLFDLLAFHHATAGVSNEAVKLLVALINLAAKSGRTSLPIVLAKLREDLEMPQRFEKLAARFAELRLRGLVRPIEGDLCEVAPELWKVGSYEAGGRWFPASNANLPAC